MNKNNFDKAPTVSIGLPVYNGENFLSEAIESILNQEYADFELIISDNASTDATESICRRYVDKDTRIIYLRSDKNFGASWNFNNTFTHSRGKYFKWAAHDDLHHPEFLSACVEHLESNPGVVLAFTRTSFIDDESQEYMEYLYPCDVSTLSREERFFHFASCHHIVHEIFGLIRADILKKTHLIDNYLGADLVLLGHLSLYGQMFQIQKLLFQHREHSTRSMHNPAGANNTTEWFDSSKKGTLVFPRWRLLFENIAVVLSFSMGYREKIRHLINLLRVISWRRKEMFFELIKPIKLLTKILMKARD